jgi:hypothetical protein
MREALGSAAAVAKGALGISSETCAESGKERRTATKAPPAEILRAVANSRNSLPFSSRLRTNTGIARGRRVHLRRSVSGFRRFNPAPWIRTYARESRIWGAKPHTRMGRLQVKRPQMRDVSMKTPYYGGDCMGLLSPFIRPSNRFVPRPKRVTTASFFCSIANCMHFSLTGKKA